MKYVLMLYLSIITPHGPALQLTDAPIQDEPTSLEICVETKNHPVVRASYVPIYGEGLVMLCVPVEE
jgi:hypothetical protein